MLFWVSVVSAFICITSFILVAILYEDIGYGDQQWPFGIGLFSLPLIGGVAFFPVLNAVMAIVLIIDGVRRLTKNI